MPAAVFAGRWRRAEVNVTTRSGIKNRAPFESSGTERALAADPFELARRLNVYYFLRPDHRPDWAALGQIMAEYPDLTSKKFA
jgi:hypothetical protein